MSHKYWRLGGYVIEEGEGGELRWGTYVDEGECGWSVFSGYAMVKLDTLIISSWKVASSLEQSWEETERWYESLPEWDKTNYFVKMVDMGGISLMDCKTLQRASEEEQERIMLKLGFYRSKVGLP